MAVAGKLSNADAIFVGVRSCCLFPSHRNNFVEDQVRAVEKWAISQHPKQISVLAIVEGTRRTNCCVVTVCAVLAIALCKNFPQMFSFLRRSDRRERDGMGHVYLGCPGPAPRSPSPL